MARKERERKFARLGDTEWLRQRYAEELRTIEEIASEVGCSGSLVHRALRSANIPKRGPGESYRLRGTKRTRNFPQLDDADWLRARYAEDGLSVSRIAALVGCTSLPVLRALTRFEIARRPAGGQLSPEAVERIRMKDALGNEGPPRQRQRLVAPKDPRQKFPLLHDPEWLKRAYEAEGRSLDSMAAEIGCTRSTLVSTLHRWGIRRRVPVPKGAVSSDLPPKTRYKTGYVEVWMPEHPACRGKGYVPQHRLVAERELGRHLLDVEVVHHVNTKRDDNRLENLMVFPNNTKHMAFHHNPPAWVPRCGCCGKLNPEALTGRPEGVPLLWVDD